MLDMLPKYEVAEAAVLMLAMPYNSMMKLLVHPEVTVVQLLVAAYLETTMDEACPRPFGYLIQIAYRRRPKQVQPINLHKAVSSEDHKQDKTKQWLDPRFGFQKVAK